MYYVEELIMYKRGYLPDTTNDYVSGMNVSIKHGTYEHFIHDGTDKLGKKATNFISLNNFYGST